MFFTELSRRKASACQIVGVISSWELDHTHVDRWQICNVTLLLFAYYFGHGKFRLSSNSKEQHVLTCWEHRPSENIHEGRINAEVCVVHDCFKTSSLGNSYIALH